jgi:hypothetical protein
VLQLQFTTSDKKVDTGNERFCSIEEEFLMELVSVMRRCEKFSNNDLKTTQKRY